jgi:hypothetical protein
MKIKDVEQFRNVILTTNAAHPERVSMEQSEIVFAAGNQPNFDLAAHTMFRALTTLRGWRQDQILETAIRETKTPTLSAWGERDQIAPQSGDGPSLPTWPMLGSSWSPMPAMFPGWTKIRLHRM